VLKNVAGDNVLELKSHYFEHKALIKPAQLIDSASPIPANEIVVVIEGDGRPWKGPGVLALDPSPPEPLMLGWYQQWQGNAIYLGRPCYFGAKELQPPRPPVVIQTSLRLNTCDPYWFSMGRYSQPVIQSMVNVLKGLLPRGARVVLLGHSGGGTLAMLVASQFEQVTAVMTLAGNLNVGQWVRYHGYTPLYGSLDPATEALLPPDIEQLHMANQGDTEILPEWIEVETKRQSGLYIQWPEKTDESLTLPGHQDWRARWNDINREIVKLGAKNAGFSSQ